MVELHPSLRSGLRGGAKQHFNRVHHAEIKQYYSENGPEATCKRFNLTQGTLGAILHRENYYKRLNKLSENDKWVFRTVMDEARDIKRRVAALESWRSEVEPVITIGRGIVSTLAQLRPGSQELPEPSSQLDIRDIGAKSWKRG